MGSCAMGDLNFLNRLPVYIIGTLKDKKTRRCRRAFQQNDNYSP